MLQDIKVIDGIIVQVNTDTGEFQATVRDQRCTAKTLNAMVKIIHRGTQQNPVNLNIPIMEIHARDTDTNWEDVDSWLKQTTIASFNVDRYRGSEDVTVYDAQGNAISGNWYLYDAAAARECAEATQARKKAEEDWYAAYGKLKRVSADYLRVCLARATTTPVAEPGDGETEIS